MNWKTDRRLLIPIPAMLLVLSLLMVEARGPYHLYQNHDPDYCYLFNSLSLLTFHVPAHVDHPGTTLQVLGAIIILGRWTLQGLISPWQPLAESVLSRPEDYLHTINFVLSLLFCGLLYLVSRRILKQTRSMLPAAVLQVSFLLFTPVFVAQTKVATEALLLVAALLLMWPLIPVVMGEDRSTCARKPRTAVLAGAAVAFGAVTKVLFFPLTAVVLLFPGARQKLRFALAVVATAALLLLPIVSRLPRVGGWIWSLLVHDGRYGTGDVALPQIDALTANIVNLGEADPSLYLLPGLYLVLLALAVFGGNSMFGGIAIFGERSVEMRRLLGAAVLAITIVLLFTIKHYAPHYPLTAMAFIPFVNASLTDALRTTIRGRRARIAAFAVGALLIGGALRHTGPRLRYWLQYSQNERDQRLELIRSAEARDDCRLTSASRASTQAYALFFGDNFATWAQRRTLADLYPEAMNYNERNGQFEDFMRRSRNDQIALELQEGRCVLVQSRTGPLEELRNFRFEPVMTLGSEQLVRLTAPIDIPVREFPLPTGSIVSKATAGGGNAPAVFEFDIPAPGYYKIMVRYASPEPRPVTLRTNGRIIVEEACAIHTGGAGAEHMRWVRAGISRFEAGPQQLELLREGPLPELDQIALVPLAK